MSATHTDPPASATLDDVSPAKTKTNPLGAGRNPRADEAAINVTIRLAPSERDDYRRAAEGEGVSLGEWIRAACATRLAARAKAAARERKARK